MDYKPFFKRIKKFTDEQVSKNIESWHFLRSNYILAELNNDVIVEKLMIMQYVIFLFRSYFVYLIKMLKINPCSLTLVKIVEQNYNERIIRNFLLFYWFLLVLAFILSLKRNLIYNFKLRHLNKRFLIIYKQLVNSLTKPN